MDNIRLLLNRFSTYLGTIKETINIENYVNDQSLNILLETKMLEILNITYDLRLENSNLIKKNFSGVDGLDKTNKIMVQVSSTVSNDKISHTVDEIISNELFKDFNHLKFVALSNKKKVSQSFQKKINEKINGRFHFNINEDIIDIRDIFSEHQNRQDIQKTHAAVSLLDEVLNYIPSKKESGFDALSICFHDEELENVYSLVDGIIKEGINVYTTSKKLHDRFNAQSHILRDLVIYADPALPVHHINFCITVLSNAFITLNSGEHNKSSCRLLKSAFENEVRTEVISFDPFLKRMKLNNDSKFRSYSSVQKENIPKTIARILSNRIKEAAYGNISLDEIRQEIINTHKNFDARTIEDNNDFSLLNLKMTDQEDIELNYIILTKDYTLSNVVQKYEGSLKKKYNKNLNVLVPKDFSHKTRRRLDAVKQALTNKVYYIDEHLFDNRYRTLEQMPILNTEDFVSPVVKHQNDYLGVNDIIHWIINNADTSVGIINGGGGIGKTTVCEKIHDMILEDHERNIVIFIDASQYIEVFKRKQSDNNAETEYDLYNIFKACHPHASIIDKNSFYLNYSLGNLIIIFDGIDEIISTIPSFSLFKFLDSLEALKLKIGKGKIIINCRDTYITDLEKFYGADNEIQIYELLPFDDDLAIKFFAKHYNNPDLVKSCVKLAKEFFPANVDSGSKYKYPPFILEIIIHIVDKDFDYEEINYNSNSALLQAEDPNDTLIFSICNREIVKKEKNGFQLDVNNQIQFLCNLAIEEKGEIDNDSFERVLQSIGLKDRLKEVAKGLHDHPLLLKRNGHHTFRFDFFKTYFKALHIFNMLTADIEIKLSDRVINTLAFECNFNSVISKTIIQKINITNVEFNKILDYSKVIIDEIIKSENGNRIENSYHKKKLISNIVLIFMKVRQRGSSDIILKLFGNRDGQIQNFYFMDVPVDSGITLDFSGLYFTNSEIINSPMFFNCIFDENTFFDESCTIDNVYSTKINLKSTKVSINNFDKNIKGDNSIFRIINIKKDYEGELKRYFTEYLKAFYPLRQFKYELIERSIKIIDDDYVRVALISRILNENDIILKIENGFVTINDKLKFKIIKFLTQGIIFSELNKSIFSLRQSILEGKI